MKICCLSDTHGHLPEDIPDCDLLLLAGDYSDHPILEEYWTMTVFRPWLISMSKKVPIFGCAGNHDIMYERSPHMVPKEGWTYLCDSFAMFKGLKIYGSPWQLRYYDWGFNLDKSDLMKKWDLIPKDTDILITHSPIYGYGDTCPNEHVGTVNIGCDYLLKTVKEIKPKLHVFGHAHSGYGRYQIDDTIVVNASFCDEKFRPAHEMIVVEI